MYNFERPEDLIYSAVKELTAVLDMTPVELQPELECILDNILEFEGKLWRR